MLILLGIIEAANEGPNGVERSIDALGNKGSGSVRRSFKFVVSFNERLKLLVFLGGRSGKSFLERREKKSSTKAVEKLKTSLRRSTLILFPIHLPKVNRSEYESR